MIIRNCKSKKDRQHNAKRKKDNWTNNDIQNKENKKQMDALDFNNSIWRVTYSRTLRYDIFMPKKKSVYIIIILNYTIKCICNFKLLFLDYLNLFYRGSKTI